jgi:HEAT repeat protein
MVASDIRTHHLRQLLIDFIQDPEPKVRQSAIRGLERVAGLDNEQFLATALQLLNDPEIEIRVQILLVLARSRDFYALPAAVQSWEQLLAEENPHLRAQGVQILGVLVGVITARQLTNVTRHGSSLKK